MTDHTQYRRWVRRKDEPTLAAIVRGLRREGAALAMLEAEVARAGETRRDLVAAINQRLEAIRDVQD